MAKKHNGTAKTVRRAKEASVAPSEDDNESLNAVAVPRHPGSLTASQTQVAAGLGMGVATSQSNFGYASALNKTALDLVSKQLLRDPVSPVATRTIGDLRAFSRALKAVTSMPSPPMNLPVLASAAQVSLDRFQKATVPLETMQRAIRALGTPPWFAQYVKDTEKLEAALKSHTVAAKFVERYRAVPIGAAMWSSYSSTIANVAEIGPLRGKLTAAHRNNFLSDIGSIANASAALGHRAIELNVNEVASLSQFTLARLLRAVDLADEPADSASDLTLRLVETEVLGQFESELEEVNPEFVEIWRGAKQAAETRGADWVRHFSVSLRELGTHLLHHLSPDEQVEAWTKDPKDYHQGKPTRMTRIRFIMRETG